MRDAEKHVIDTAVPGDFLAVAALDRVAWQGEHDRYIPDGEHVWRVWCEHALVMIARPSSASRRATQSEYDADEGRAGEAETAAAGAVVAFPSIAGDDWFLHKLMVHPGARGAGLGTRLMNAVIAEARRPLLLTVDPTNTPAVELYRKFGFDVVERIDGYYRPQEHRYLMRHPGAKEIV